MNRSSFASNRSIDLEKKLTKENMDNYPFLLGKESWWGGGGETKITAGYYYDVFLWFRFLKLSSMIAGVVLTGTVRLWRHLGESQRGAEGPPAS